MLHRVCSVGWSICVCGCSLPPWPPPLCPAPLSAVASGPRASRLSSLLCLPFTPCPLFVLFVPGSPSCQLCFSASVWSVSVLLAFLRRPSHSSCSCALLRCHFVLSSCFLVVLRESVVFFVLCVCLVFLVVSVQSCCSGFLLCACRWRVLSGG